MEGKFKERPPAHTTFPTPSPHTTTTKSTKTAVDKKSWLFVPYLHPTDPLFLCSYWSSFPAGPTDPVFLFCTLILTIFLWRQSGRRTQAISLSDDSFADVTLWDMYEATPESSLNDLTDNERNWLGTVLLRDFPEYRHVQDIFFLKNFQLTVQILLRHIFTFCYYSLLCWKINLLFTVLYFSVKRSSRDRALCVTVCQNYLGVGAVWDSCNPRRPPPSVDSVHLKIKVVGRRAISWWSNRINGTILFNNANSQTPTNVSQLN